MKPLLRFDRRQELANAVEPVPHSLVAHAAAKFIRNAGNSPEAQAFYVSLNGLCFDQKGASSGRKRFISMKTTTK